MLYDGGWLPPPPPGPCASLLQHLATGKFVRLAFCLCRIDAVALTLHSLTMGEVPLGRQIICFGLRQQPPPLPPEEQQSVGGQHFGVHGWHGGGGQGGGGQQFGGGKHGYGEVNAGGQTTTGGG